AVVGVEDLGPGLAVECPPVRAPLAEAATVTVADPAHEERDDRVVAGRRGRHRLGHGDRQERSGREPERRGERGAARAPWGPGSVGEPSHSPEPYRFVTLP